MNMTLAEQILIAMMEQRIEERRTEAERMQIHVDMLQAQILYEHAMIESEKMLVDGFRQQIQSRN